MFTINCGSFNVSRVAPVLSHNGKFIFVVCGQQVRVISLLSGDTVQSLVWHKQPVTSLKLSTLNPLQLISTSLDKYLVIWDYEDGVVLKKFKLEYPVLAFWQLNFMTRHPFICLQQQLSKNVVFQVDLLGRFQAGQESNAAATQDPQLLLSDADIDPNLIAVGTRDEFLVSAKEGTIVFVNLQTKRQARNSLGRSHDKFTCIACHQNEYCVATGATSGEIRIWRNFLISDRMVSTVLQWHILPLKAISFTVEGSFLLSGGSECVLVKWPLDGKNQNFLPRMGAPIQHILCDYTGEQYVIVLSDNSICVLGSNFVSQQVIQGWGRRFEPYTETPVGLTFEPNFRCLVSNGKPGHLQFYDPASAKLSCQLDVVDTNMITSTSLDDPLPLLEVEKCAFSSQGIWMATFERWQDKEIPPSPEMRLKFWGFVPEQRNYELNTCFEMPHSGCVTSLKFNTCSQSLSADEFRLVSTSSDGTFKIWIIVDSHSSKSYWDCGGVCYNVPLSQVPCLGADFNLDSSLLVVNFNPFVSVWSPDTYQEQTKLHIPHYGSPPSVRDVCFIQDEKCSSTVVTITESYLYLWNLALKQIQCKMELNCDILARDNISTHFSVITKSGSVLIFNAEATALLKDEGSGSLLKPIATIKAICQDGADEHVTHVVFTPLNHIVDKFGDLENVPESEAYLCSMSSLFVLTDQQNLYQLMPRSFRQKRRRTIAPQPQQEQSALSKFLLGGSDNRNKSSFKDNPSIKSEIKTEEDGFTGSQHQQTATTVPSPSSHSMNNDQFLKDFVETPAYMMPSTDDLALPFLLSFLPPLQTSTHDDKSLHGRRLPEKRSSQSRHSWSSNKETTTEKTKPHFDVKLEPMEVDEGNKNFDKSGVTDKDNELLVKVQDFDWLPKLMKKVARYKVTTIVSVPSSIT